ncbi:MAG: hypothetical protein KKD28_03540 [Chloroflexi bacterium]|nr:hypothetical protein [Chloroflexota bacterium]MBU1660528.1 hypothetical protein [Chloroflexota bacterium]
MRICIDSCVFIHALDESDPDNLRLLDNIGNGLMLMIPCLVAQEVTRNLQTLSIARQGCALIAGSGDFGGLVLVSQHRDRLSTALCPATVPPLCVSLLRLSRSIPCVACPKGATGSQSPRH